MSKAGLYKTVEYFNQPQLAERAERFTLMWDTQSYADTIDPSVWGPPTWCFLHTSSAHYPVSPDNDTKNATKSFIMSLPFTLPCVSCKHHAIMWVNAHKHKLDTIVQSRDSLFKFYVDFHNYVNKRLGKPIMSYAEAYNKYRNGVNVNRLKF